MTVTNNASNKNNKSSITMNEFALPIIIDDEIKKVLGNFLNHVTTETQNTQSELKVIELYIAELLNSSDYAQFNITASHIPALTSTIFKHTTYLKIGQDSNEEAVKAVIINEFVKKETIQRNNKEEITTTEQPQVINNATDKQSFFEKESFVTPKNAALLGGAIGMAGAALTSGLSVTGALTSAAITGGSYYYADKMTALLGEQSIAVKSAAITCLTGTASFFGYRAAKNIFSTTEEDIAVINESINLGLSSEDGNDSSTAVINMLGYQL